MNIQQLETFIYVAEHLNFAKAAEALNITQSAVSRQIHSLENELDTRLLHRTTRTVSLTPAGMSFLEDARYIMERLKFATAKIRHNTEYHMQTLSIGCGNDMHLDFLHNILDICRKEIPSFHPFLRVISHRFLLNLFYQGDIDLLVGFQNDIPVKDDVIYDELFCVPLCCAFSSTHPCAAKKEMSEQDLLSENLITCNSYAIPAKAAELQDRIARYLPPESIYFCDSFPASLALVRAGYGYSILPGGRYKSDQICYVPLKDSEPLSYGIFYRKGPQNPLLKKFVAIAKNSVQESLKNEK